MDWNALASEVRGYLEEVWADIIDWGKDDARETLQLAARDIVRYWKDGDELSLAYAKSTVKLVYLRAAIKTRRGLLKSMERTLEILAEAGKFAVKVLMK